VGKRVFAVPASSGAGDLDEICNTVYPEVTCCVTRETPAEQGFHCFRGWAFWLLQGEWDRRVDEFEGSALGGGGYCEQLEAGLVVAGDS